MKNFVVIAALLATVTEAVVPGMMGGMYPQMMPPKGMPPRMLHERPAGKILTCQLNFRDVNDPSMIVNSISVNIREKEESFSGPGHMGQMGMNLVNHGEQKPGLEAKIGIFSAIGGKVTVAFTETARPQDGCVAESFGRFLRDFKPPRLPMSPKMGMVGKYGVGGMGMMNKYAMPGFGMKYGAGAMPGYGMTSIKSHTRTPFGSTGIAKHSQGFGMGGVGMMGMGSPIMMGMGFNNPMMGMGMMGMGMGHHVEEQPEGVIATTDVAPGIKASIVIDRLKSFERLDQVAGRGVVVCPAENVEHDFDMNSKCSGGILSCCALHYDMEEVHLGGNSAMAHHDVHNHMGLGHAPRDDANHNYKMD